MRMMLLIAVAVTCPSPLMAAIDNDTNCLGYPSAESKQYCRDESGDSVLCSVEGGSPIPSKAPRAIAWRNGYFTGRAEAEGKVGVMGPTYWPMLELFCIENPNSNYYQAMRYMYENHYLDLDKPRWVP